MVTAFGASGNWASARNRESFHHFNFGADLVLFPFIFWYVAIHGRKLGQTVFAYYSASFCVGLGLLLIFWDIVRHILLDHAVEGSPFEASLAMYDDNGLSPMGRFSKSCSIVGSVLLTVGMLSYVCRPMLTKP